MSDEIKKQINDWYDDNGIGLMAILELNVILEELRLNERNLKAEIEQLQKELDEAIEIIEFSGVDYDEVLEAIRNDQ